MLGAGLWFAGFWFAFVGNLVPAAYYTVGDTCFWFAYGIHDLLFARPLPDAQRISLITRGRAWTLKIYRMTLHRSSLTCAGDTRPFVRSPVSH